MIVVVDSGVANLASVLAAFHRMGTEVVVSSEADVIEKADRVILPGVGSAGFAMQRLKDRKLVDVLRALKQPVLGICLGMQILFEESAESQKEEGEGTVCLGVIKGKIQKLQGSADCPVPHMGWNQIWRSKGDHPLLAGVQEGAYVYFVHSYAAVRGEFCVAHANYDQDFTALAQYKNFYGCQFHPERSGEVGAQIIQNFMRV